LPRQERGHHLDAGRDGLGDHLEVSLLHPARRRLAGRVLLDRRVERPAAGGFRDQDAASRQEHDEPHHLQGHLGRPLAEHLSAHRKATNARNFTNCDSLLIGNNCGAHTVPYIESKNASAVFEHEATTSKISEDQLFYCMQRGLGAEEATALIVNGFVKDVLQKLPMEFAVEAQKLIAISLEGSVG
jgi:hypothetical protein